MVVPILSYFVAHWMIGWASAPYNPEWQQRYPRRAAWMALGGPAANFALVIIAAISIHVGIFAGAFRMPSVGRLYARGGGRRPGNADFAATFLSILFVLNLLLGTFNLLPVPPLDGNTVGHPVHERIRRAPLRPLDAHLPASAWPACCWPGLSMIESFYLSSASPWPRCIPAPTEASSVLFVSAASNDEFSLFSQLYFAFTVSS